MFAEVVDVRDRTAAFKLRLNSRVDLLTRDRYILPIMKNKWCWSFLFFNFISEKHINNINFAETIHGKLQLNLF